MFENRLYPALIQTTIIFLSIFGYVTAGGTQSDYDRSAALQQKCQNKVFRNDIDAVWLPDGHTFWYKVKTGTASHEFIFVNAQKNVRQPAFDHTRLAEALKQNGFDRCRQDQLPLEKLEFDLQNNQLKFQVTDILFQCDLETYLLKKIGTAPIESLPAYLFENAPKVSRQSVRQVTITFINRSQQEVELFWLDTSGGRISYGKLQPGNEREQNTHVGHLWLISNVQSEPVCIYEATDQNAKAVIGVEEPQEYHHRVNRRNRRSRDSQPNPVSPDGTWEVFIKNHNVGLRNTEDSHEVMLTEDGTETDGYQLRFFWSPDSKKLVVIRQKEGPEHKVHFVESSPRDQLQPKLHSFDYLKPGDTLNIDRPCLFDISTQKQIPVSNELFSNPYNVYDYQWSSDSKRFTFTYNQRGHQVLRVVGIDADSGTTVSVIEETSDTFICYSGKYYCMYLDQTDEIIWMSERDGWNHLYLYDAKTARIKNQITKGAWVVRGIDHVDQENRQIWFRLSGLYPKQDPYYVHYARINFDGSGLMLLTEGDGTHTAAYSPDKTYLIDTWSRVDQPPIHELRRCDNGNKICELEQADWTELLDTGWQIPERFNAKGRDGITDIYGIILRPTNFDPNQSYPVIEDIYAGPQDSFVPKSFKPFYWIQQLAELGFIVVKIDGMGTSNRSKKFHNVCWKNLADAGFPDRIAWIKSAAQKYPYMDITRVGIYGGSAGGQSAAGAVLLHGIFYKAAAADCGCHDNRMDKIWWNEQWMGWPVGPEYQSNSNVTHAGKLQGKLLLITGEMDRNVDPASTMQLVNALIKADKDFELLIIPGAGHGAGSSQYGRRRQADFFVRHLLGVEPRRIP